MSRDSKHHDQLCSSVNRRDVLKTVAGTATAGALGAFGAGTAAGATDLEVHYAFDESSGATTATDSSGNGRDATINGGVTAGGSGQDGTAFDFDGSSSATVVDSSAGTYINELDEITIAAWVKSDSTSNDRGIFNGATDGGDSADDDVCLRYDSTGWDSGNVDLLKAAIRYDDGSGTITQARVETESNLQTTSWQHVALAWSAGDQPRVYVDGSEVSYGYTQSTPSSATIAGQSAFAIGEAVHSDTWDGTIDDVRLYSRRLSASEIASLASTSSDTTAPTAPSNLSSPGKTDASVDLDWDASSDSGGSGLDHYNVYVDADKDHEISAGTASTTVTGLSADTSYDFHVTAVDGAGNESNPSSTITVTTVSGSSSNLLANPGFENGTTAWSARKQETLSTVSNPVHDGSAAAESSNRSNPWDGPVQDVAADLSANGEGTYSWEAYVRLGSGTGTARVTVHINDNSGDNYHYDTGSIDDSGWTRVTASLNLSWSGLNEATFYVETESSLADLYVDDASFTFEGQGSSPPGDYDFAFLADDIRTNWYHHRYPAAYSSAANTTFVVYESQDAGGTNSSEADTAGDAYAVAYDHDADEVVGQYRVGYNYMDGYDDHGVPSLVIDGDGYVHVFFGAHGYFGAFQYARSENAYDISSWVHPPSGNLGSADLNQLPDGTYPNLTYNPDEDAIYVLYRKGGDTDHNYGVLGRSGDGGVTWTNVNSDIMNFTDGPGSHNDAYVCSLGAWAGRIHMSWTMAAAGGGHDDARRNVYHAAYNPATGNAETTSGTDLGSTITWYEAESYCKVKDTGTAEINDQGDSCRGFNHAYDPITDTAYIPAKYAIDDNTSQHSVFSYQGVSDQSGSWVETKIIQQSPPEFPTAEIHLNENGRVEAEGPNANDEPGLWIQQSDGSYDHTAIALPADVDWIQRGVVNGRSEFAWYAGGNQGDGSVNMYAMGHGLPSDADADYTKPPKKLRVVSEGSGTATIDWDHGRTGPSGLEKYRVYVDGSWHTDVTATPTWYISYPKTWADLSLSAGQHTIEVTLVNKDGAESAKSNSVTVDV